MSKFIDEKTGEIFWFDTVESQKKFQPNVKPILYQTKSNGDVYDHYNEKATLVDGQYYFMGSDTPILNPAEIAGSSKINRDAALESPINYLGEVWDIDKNARENIGVVLRKAERIGAPDTESRPWRLENDAWRETTLKELRELLYAYDDRFEDVWYRYTQWDIGDKTEVFVYQQ